MIEAIVRSKLEFLVHINSLQKFTRAELLEFRGIKCSHFARYTDDSTNSNQRSTVMWNPLLYAIYFRQYTTINFLVDDL